MTSVVVDTDGTTEYEARLSTVREGENLATTRVMAGQAPFLINGYLNYSNENQTFNINLAYNVQGETLNVVGGRNIPDVYTQAFHSLNMNMYRDFGTVNKSRITFGVSNILGSTRTNRYQPYQAASKLSSNYDLGRTFSLKYSYSF